MKKFYYKIPFLLQNTFFFIFLPLYKFFLKLEIKGKENLKNLNGPILVVSNHTSELDPTVIPLIFPFLSKNLPVYSVTYPLERYRLSDFGWRRHVYRQLFFKLLGGYPIFSGKKDYQISLQNHLEILRQNRTLCIFPEGRCTNNGNIMEAHGGAGYLAFHANPNVVPIVLDSFFGLSFFDFIFRRNKFTITILPTFKGKELFNTLEPGVDDYKSASQKVLDMIKQFKPDKIYSYVDHDKSLNMENKTFFRSIFNFVLIYILNILPKSFKDKIKKTDVSAKEVIDNATTHHALEVLYSKGKMFSAKSIVNSIFKNIWFHMDNSKAVRNRLKLVIRELKLHLKSVASYDREINIISIASGSARAVIETVEDGTYLRDTKLSLTFLDKNPNAIEYSKKLSTKIQHLPVKIDWINGTAGSFLRDPGTKKFDVVEIVGLLDYFTDEKVVEMFKGIYEVLSPGGIVITANINHNREEKFVSNMIDWVMIYRTADELARLIAEAGFEKNKMKVFYEPFKIHGMVVAKK